MPTRRPTDGQGRHPNPNSGKARRIRSDVKASASEPPSPGISPVADPAEQALAASEVARSSGPEYKEAQRRARSGDPSELLPYAPTPSINPPRPRTVAAGYSKDEEVLTIQFRDGAVYDYYNVPPNVWKNFRRVKSPGRHINRVLNNYTYNRRTDLEG